MGDDLNNLMQQIEHEAESEGPAAVAELRDLEAHFKLGADLFGRRRALGLSQSALSKRSGVQQADVNRIEHGQANPAISTVAQLVSAMGGGSVTITWKGS